MGIGYVRVKKVIKKECEKCGTMWDDSQIVEDVTGKHGYGGDNCPFCHSSWELTVSRKIPTLKLKLPATDHD